MNLTTLRNEIATVAAGITNVRGASGQELDSIPGTPYVIVGQPSGRLSPGNRQVVELQLPLRLYVARIADEKRTVTKADDLFNSFLTTFAGQMTLGGNATLAYISSFDFGRVWEVGGEAYRTIDFTLSVTVRETVTYAP